MKQAFVFTVFILAAARALSQPTFINSYLQILDSSVYSSPVIVKCNDGSFMGTNVSLTAAHCFLLFKISPSGNMIWQKTISFGTTDIVLPNKICALSDATIAIVFDIWSTQGFGILKCDLSGNIIWANSYIPQSGKSVPDITADVNGGMIVSNYTYISFVNSNGTITNTIQFNGGRVIQSISNGSGSAIVYGFLQTNPSVSIFLCEVNSAGTLNNYVELVTPDTIGSLTVYPSDLISKAPSGNTYCMYSITPHTGTHFMIACFDALGQPAWVKKIKKDHIYPRTLLADNNGCILSADFVSGSYKVPVVMRFDNSGNNLWTKFPGDTFDPDWNYFQINSIIPDQGMGWYCVTSNNGLTLAHVDSLFDGFCDYVKENSPSIANLTFTIGTNTITTNSTGYTLTPLTPSTIIESFYRYDACTQTLLDSSIGIFENPLPEIGFEVYPNPTRDFVTVELKKNIHDGILSVFNTIGEVVASYQIEGVFKKEIKLEQLTPGMYMISLSDQEGICWRKLLVE